MSGKTALYITGQRGRHRWMGGEVTDDQDWNFSLKSLAVSVRNTVISVCETVNGPGARRISMKLWMLRTLKSIKHGLGLLWRGFV